ncbi:MAG: M48 family metallopeptidase [Neisseria sp.]|uniref:M48 family metallopeptidase n=1 Tax=Neisseria sp. TaxID=192066 RepID=UPI0026DD3473|nr:M48 family metallopeptidase [Neisseria sp.]MDO4640121.1 M48 family metallopeptidase [Neisseria sp.]
MKKTVLQSAILLILGGCTAVAEMAGYNTAALNQASAKQYRQMMRIADGRYLVDTESETAHRIQHIFECMKPYAERANQTGTPFDWQMTVIKSKELNAWAMPGGKMAFYTGMVDLPKLTDDEIAAVIGHEMTHALKEHGKKKAGQQVLTRIAGQATGIALQATTGVSGGFANLGADVLTHYGVKMTYSRSQENQADEGGMKLMAQAGYNPQGAVSLWQKLEKIESNDNLKTAIVSSHPTNKRRMENLQKMLPEALKAYQPQSCSESSASDISDKHQYALVNRNPDI